VKARGDDVLALATRAYADAAYHDCRLILSVAGSRKRSHSERAAYALLEARCARYQDDFATWLTAADYAFAHHGEPNKRMEALALRALARTRTGAMAAAADDFERVRRVLERQPAHVNGMPLYYLAYARWIHGDYAAAQALAQRNVAAGRAQPMSLALSGWSELKRGDWARAGATFSEALLALDASREPDRRLRATLLHAISVVAGETVDLKLARSVRRACADFAWPASLTLERVRTLAASQIIALLEGDLARAWSLAREAVVRAPDRASEACAEIRFAATSRFLGDDRVAAAQFARAWAFVREARPRGGGAAEAARVVLLFASEAAHEMPAEAIRAFKLYNQVLAVPRARRTIERDPRLRGSELVAAARIAEVQGERRRAKALYADAFEFWQQRGLAMRAAIVARDLRRLTRDRQYEVALEAMLARAPNAWLGSRSSAAADVLQAITPAEKLVLGAMLEGKSARAIAHDLKRSVHTVNNHTRKIFKAFDVTSRAGVLARCASSGISPTSLGRTP